MRALNDNGNAHTVVGTCLHTELYNIGYDQILGYTTRDALDALTNHRREIPVIGFDTLKENTKEKNAWIVDVRTLPEYENDGFQGATHASMQRLNEYLPSFPSDAPLYVHCQAGGRAAMCSSYLHGLGYQVVLVDGVKPKTL